MPLNREAYSRYRLIDARLRKKPNPTLSDIIEYVCENLDKPVSKRTIQLDIQEMRYNQNLKFEAPIEYDSRNKVYCYSNPDYSITNLPVTADELHGLDFAISILNQFRHLPAIREFEDAILKIASTVQINKQSRGESDYLQLDKPFVIKGIEYVEPILKAITQRRVIVFTYQKLGSDKISRITLEPYLIREAKNFWYVIGNGISKQQHKILTFALDRISDLQLMDDTFTTEKIDKKTFYKNVLGVTVGDGKPEKVVLSFEPVQGQYIKTVPIHASQQIIKENSKEVRVQLDLFINTELKMQLLSYGSRVRVLQPLTLAQEIQQTATEMIELYR